MKSRMAASMGSAAGRAGMGPGRHGVRLGTGRLGLGSHRMLFRRRKRAAPFEKVRVALWPRRSFARSFNYIKYRVLRLEATPHAIAAGVAAGVFASCTPFVGFHFVLAFVFAWMVGGSMLAAAFGTAFGNPLTFPIVWIASFRLGELFLGADATVRSPLELRPSFEMITNSFGTLWPTLKPMLIGGTIIGLTLGAAVYFAVRSAVLISQSMRRARLERAWERNLARRSAAHDADARGQSEAATRDERV